MSLDLSESIRAAVVAESAVTGELPAYKGSYPVFTRVPVPDDAPYPMIVVPDEAGAGDEDGIDFLAPVVVRDVVVYGRNDSVAHYLQAVALADAVWELFHRRRASIEAPAGWSVTDVRASRPRPAPDDGEQLVGRRVELTVRLSRQL